MNDHLAGLDSAMTREPLSVYPVSTLSPGIIMYSYSTPAPSKALTTSAEQVTLTLVAPTLSASYRPTPPHIAIPSQTHPAFTAATGAPISTGAIVGIVLGVLALVIASTSAIFYFYHRKRKLDRADQGSSQDIEKKGATFDLRSHHFHFEDSKAPPLSDLDKYTEYVPRTEGRLSPVSQMVPTTFGRIKEHHTSSDPFADPKYPSTCNNTREGTSERRIDAIDMVISPSHARLK
ncbi:hypothetical protein DXG01_007870 [Tephrocybe rancida]|nr:hypothetical protein DXG01_007870 [Tephrocybe rancida]